MLKALVKLSRIQRAIYSLEIFGALWIYVQVGLIRLTCLKSSIIHFLLFFVGFQTAYFAVYIINDILDYSKDKANKFQQHKPLVSGEFSKKQAKLLALVHIIIGYGILFVLRDIIGSLITSFALIYNLFYTLILKKNHISKIIGNSFTHTFRILIPLFWFLRQALFSTIFWHLYVNVLFATLIFVLNYLLFGTILSNLKQISIGNKIAKRTHESLIKIFVLIACVSIIVVWYLHMWLYMTLIIFLLVISLLLSRSKKIQTNLYKL